jgi:hypothetical protein
MWSGLGYQAVWYMVINAKEECTDNLQQAARCGGSMFLQNSNRLPDYVIS